VSRAKKNEQETVPEGKNPTASVVIEGGNVTATHFGTGGLERAAEVGEEGGTKRHSGAVVTGCAVSSLEDVVATSQSPSSHTDHRCSKKSSEDHASKVAKDL